MPSSNRGHLRDVTSQEQAVTRAESIDKKACLLLDLDCIKHACHRHGRAGIIDQRRSGVNLKHRSQCDKPVN